MRSPCLDLVAIALLALLPTGCIRWGLGEARGYEAARGQESARQQHASASAIKDVLDLFAEEFEAAGEELTQAIAAVDAELDAIMVRASDDYILATVRQDDHGYKPRTPPVLGSVEDDRQVNAYSGHANSREVARKRRAELREAAGDAAASFAANIITRTIPAPVRWSFWISLIGSIITAAVAAIWRLLRWALRERRVADDAHDHIADLIAEAKKRGATPEELAAIARGHPYARARHIERQLAGTAD